MEMPCHVFAALAGLMLMTAVPSFAQAPLSDNSVETASDRAASVATESLGPYDTDLSPSGDYGGFVQRPPAFPPGGVFSYPSTDNYNSIVDTNGWPVAMPFTYYPQGAVSEEGVGVYQCLLPADKPEDCFCTPPPCYFGTFYVEGLIFNRRSNLERTPLLLDSTATEVLSTGDLNLSTEAGYRIGFWISHPSGIDWNVDYFNVGNFVASETITDAAGTTTNFMGVASTVPTQTGQYESLLQSLECTLRVRQWRRMAPLVGARFIQIDEHFNIIQDAATRQGLFSECDNQLYGMQFGFQGLICEHHWWRLETALKVGPFYNNVALDATSNPVGGTQTRRHVGLGTTALVGDARVGLVCQLGPRVNFRIGYQAVWIDGVALGPNQNNNISFTTNVDSVDLSGVLYQGGDIGFEVSW